MLMVTHAYIYISPVPIGHWQNPQQKQLRPKSRMSFFNSQPQAVREVQTQGLAEKKQIDFRLLSQTCCIVKQKTIEAFFSFLKKPA